MGKLERRIWWTVACFPVAVVLDLAEYLVFRNAAPPRFALQLLQLAALFCIWDFPGRDRQGSAPVGPGGKIR